MVATSNAGCARLRQPVNHPNRAFEAYGGVEKKGGPYGRAATSPYPSSPSRRQLTMRAPAIARLEMSASR